MEELYPAGKAAVRSSDVLDSYRLTLLRNAGAMMLSVMDENGQELYNSGVSNRKHGAYYYVNGGIWQNTSADYSLGFTAGSLGLSEGDRFTVTVTAIPEYYIQGQTLNAAAVHAIADSGILGQGAALTTELVVDDTAPEIVSIARDIETGAVVVTMSDNQYVAALRIVDAAGTVHTTQAVPAAGAAGGLQQVTLNWRSGQGQRDGGGRRVCGRLHLHGCHRRHRLCCPPTPPPPARSGWRICLPTAWRT